MAKAFGECIRDARNSAGIEQFELPGSMEDAKKYAKFGYFLTKNVVERSGEKIRDYNNEKPYSKWMLGAIALNLITFSAPNPDLLMDFAVSGLTGIATYKCSKPNEGRPGPKLDIIFGIGAFIADFTFLNIAHRPIITIASAAIVGTALGYRLLKKNK